MHTVSPLANTSTARPNRLSSLRSFAALAGALVAAAGLSAADLVHYNFNTTGDEALALRTTADGVVSSAIAYQTTLSRNSYNAGNSNYQVQFIPLSGSLGGTTAAEALVSGAYFDFSITVQPGFTLTLDGFSFDIRTSSNTGSRAFYLFSSKTGFEADDVLFSRNLTNGLSGTLTNFETSLSSIGALAADETIQFRVYLQTGGASQSFTLDNVKLTGSVSPVPEPASAAALAGLGLLGWTVTSRRRAPRR